MEGKLVQGDAKKGMKTVEDNGPKAGMKWIDKIFQGIIRRGTT